MILDFLNSLQNYLRVINQILAAGIAINAFALLLYALSFNLRDRVARSFALILICVCIVFSADAVGSVASSDQQIDLWFHIQWVGIIWLPATYLQLSHALLMTTGTSYKGWRNTAVKISYLISFLFMLSLPYSSLVGAVIIDQKPAPYLQPTLLTYIFTIYYFGAMALSWVNFFITFRRTTTPTSQRRMAYLIIGALAPALGSFPYLLFGSSFAANHSLTFWLTSVIINLFVGGLIIIMAYTVAFFGVSWPDRIVRSRLFKWILRGPVTAIITLALVTIVRRIGENNGVSYSTFVPIIMIASILLLEFTITVFGTIWQKWLFPARDREDLETLRTLESHLLTRNDLGQFLEMILAAVCDRLQVKGAYIATINQNDLDLLIHIGEMSSDLQATSSDLIKIVTDNQNTPEMFQWSNDCLLLLQQENTAENTPVIGILGISNLNGENLDDEQRKALNLLANRAALALSDRQTQEKVFQSIQSLTPQMEMFQQVRAASRFDRTSLLSEDIPSVSEDMVVWVKDALGHYWGGPKLTKSPLMQLNVVQNAYHSYDGNSVNALRAILRQSIERVRPEGERHFTADWILYNILEMKFLEGKKVREIALRLAMSEADLYRKQRIAIEAVAKEIQKMETEAHAPAAENPA